MKEHRLYFFVSLLFVILIGYGDHKTGAHVSMLLLYALPILLSAWFCGKSGGILVAAAATISWLTVTVLRQPPGENSVILSWNTFTRFGIFVLIAYAVSLQAQLRKAFEREKLRANTDRLTGLLNKGAFRERVEEEMNRARRYQHPLSLAFIDLDDFKQVNDTQGHSRGDRLLQDVSEIIILTIRKTDIAGRVGGDEFAVFFPEADGEQVRTAIEKLVNALDIMTSQSGWQMTASIGVVTCTEIRETYDTLLGTADKLMYVAKEKGKNAAEFMTFDGSSLSCENRPSGGARNI